MMFQNFDTRFASPAQRDEVVCSGSIMASGTTPLSAFTHCLALPSVKHRAVFLNAVSRLLRATSNSVSPTWTLRNGEKLIEQNFMSLGMGLIETGMAWFWSDASVKKWFDVEGYANLINALKEQRGVMVVGVHFMSLELGVRWGCVVR
jgi:KDO2-lipid IV(A) palmitoleoyltransferase